MPGRGDREPNQSDTQRPGTVETPDLVETMMA